MSHAELWVQKLSTVPPPNCTKEALPSEGGSKAIKVLPSMALRTLRIKAFKALKITPSSSYVRLFAILNTSGGDLARGGSVVAREMDLETDGRKEIDFWLEDGSGVGILIDVNK